VGNRAGLKTVEKKKKFLSVPGIEPRFGTLDNRKAGKYQGEECQENKPINVHNV
jgi:hypothetical protein